MVDLPWILHHLSVEQLNHFQLLNFEWNQTKKSLFLSIFFFFCSKRTVFLCCSTANVQSSERNPIPRSLVDCVRVRHRMIYAEYARQPAKIPRIRVFIFYWINFVFYSVFCFFFLVLFWMPVIRWLTFFRQINRGKRGAEGTNAVNLNLWQNAWTNPSAYTYIFIVEIRNYGDDDENGDSLTPSHGRLVVICLTVPRPSASRFLCAENRRSSLRSSSLSEWQ